MSIDFAPPAQEVRAVSAGNTPICSAAADAGGRTEPGAMASTIAIIADTHVPDVPDTAEWAAVEWAVVELARLAPDVVIVAGDVTACGGATGAARFLDAAGAIAAPVLVTPGNSDLRSRKGAQAAAELLRGPTIHSDNQCLFVAADTSSGALPAAERRRLDNVAEEAGRRRLVLATHLPPEALDAESRAWLTRWAGRSHLSLLIAAHRHQDEQHAVGEAAAHTVRGLDPNKAIGGPPCLTLLEWSAHRWWRRDVPFAAATPGKWSAEERREFRRLLGISCMADPISGLELAQRLEVRCVELRSTATTAPREPLRDRIAAWRNAGGEYLSWHQPSLFWEPEIRNVRGAEEFEATLAVALDLGVEALTVHVPVAPVGLMQPGAEAWRQLSDAFAGLLAPAVDRGVTLGIENMHMAPGEPADDSRRFGYLPDECTAWVEELRARLDGLRVGMTLDIGHARNNAPFASEFTLGVWYALTGGDAVGYHLHQVTLGDSGMRNHQPIRGLYGPLISLSSFLWAWKTGQLNHASMFLEIRDQAEVAGSLHALRAALRHP